MDHFQQKKSQTYKRQKGPSIVYGKIGQTYANSDCHRYIYAHAEDKQSRENV